MAGSNNVILIGFMGAGKTTIGREVARLQKSIVLDTDSIIETNCGMRVSEIFERFGEAHFREMEVSVCEFIRKNVRNAVISAGGGTVESYDLRDIGEVFYLKAPLEVIFERIDGENRPLFRGKDEVAALYEKRIKLYSKQANHTLNALDSVPQIANRIYDYMRGF